PLRRVEEPRVRGRPRAPGLARPLGVAGTQEQPEAPCPAPGRARLHEEGRHDRQAVREVVRPQAGARWPRGGDHAGLRPAGWPERWSGQKPAPDGLEVVITPGYGPPGFPGYDPTSHELHCN